MAVVVFLAHLAVVLIQATIDDSLQNHTAEVWLALSTGSAAQYLDGRVHTSPIKLRRIFWDRPS
jgi:hypothetical protein